MIDLFNYRLWADGIKYAGGGPLPWQRERRYADRCHDDRPHIPRLCRLCSVRQRRHVTADLLLLHSHRRQRHLRLQVRIFTARGGPVLNFRQIRNFNFIPELLPSLFRIFFKDIWHRRIYMINTWWNCVFYSLGWTVFNLLSSFHFFYVASLDWLI